jgi:hypothetical protein
MARSDLRSYPADKARGAEIVLRKPWQRAVFMAGLAGSILLLLALDLS